MFPMMVGLFELWARFFDFYLDDRTINHNPPDMFWTGGTIWDVLIAGGAIATALAFGFIWSQTKSIKSQSQTFEKQLEESKKQTRQSQDEIDFRLRPWLYPTDTTKHLQLIIGISDDSLMSVIDVHVKKKFENAGVFPTKKVYVYVKGNDKKIDDFKSGSETSDLTAVFPKQEFCVSAILKIKDLHLVDRENVIGEDFKFTRYKLDKHLYISVLLDFEYLSGNSKNHGYYQALFRIDKLQHYGSEADNTFEPVFDIVDEDVG